VSNTISKPNERENIDRRELIKHKESKTLEALQNNGAKIVDALLKLYGCLHTL
jgi:hypothetical protein